MPKGHAPKRESKKAKKKADGPILTPPSQFVSPEVEVIKRKRKRRNEEE